MTIYCEVFGKINKNENENETYKGTESINQERLRQQAIKDKEKERTQFYQKQREEAKVERTKIREKV